MYDPEVPDGYQDADIEMAQMVSTGREIDAYLDRSKGGKAIDADAKVTLERIVANTWDGSVTLAMIQWLAEAGYDATTPEAQDAMFKALTTS
jgi:hypothetical protein